MFVIFWLSGCFIPIVLAASILFYYSSFVQKNVKSPLVVLGLISVVSGLCLSVTMMYTFLAGFGPGMFMALSSIVTAVIVSLAVSLVQNSSLDLTDYKQRKLANFQLGIGVLVVFAQFMPPFVAWGGVSLCDSLHRQGIGDIVTAVEKYKAQTGTYPSEIEELLQFEVNVPVAVCLQPYKPLFRLAGMLIDDEPRIDDFGYKLRSCSETIQ